MRTRALCLVLALSAAGCDRPGASPRPGRPEPAAPSSAPAATTEAPPAPPSAAAPPPAAPPAPKRLDAPAPLVDLAVPGHADAVAWIPIGATSPRPIVIASHGNYDRPEWQCQVWGGILEDRAFVLCPRGIPRPDSPAPDDIRFTYADNRALEREIDAGLEALRARFPDHAGPDPVLYTGFSLGAIMGVAIVSRRPERFTRAVLVEGGHDKWTPAAAAAFAALGGERRGARDAGERGRRVLFACGQKPCAFEARRPAAILERAGVATKIVHGPGVGHGYGGAVADAIAAELPWLLEGDARFSPRAPVTTSPSSSAGP